MKRFFLMIALVAVAINVVADDLIITNDSKCIKAKIVEISKSEIRYKDASNLSGPIFVLETSEVQNVVYENGQVQIFSQSATTPTTASTPSAPSTSNVNFSNHYSSTSEVQRQDYTNNANYGQIIWSNDGYYLNGQKIASGRNELQSWMSKNAPAIVQDYYRFQNSMSKMAKYSGVLMLPIGGTGVIVGSILASGGPKDGSIFVGGVACAVTGGLILSAGVPMLIVGSVRSKRSDIITWYNDHSRSYSQLPMQLELQSSADGIGLALKF